VSATIRNHLHAARTQACPNHPESSCRAMQLLINGVRLWFDVEGAALVPDGPRMREKPTLILLHGGPGADHSLYKPAFSSMADAAQVIYLDHRGNGRSESGPQEHWTLGQWADDLRAFCETLHIEKPVVYGASFGGLVAMAYAQRHPQHARALVLVSTTAEATAHVDAKVAMFRQLGGNAAVDLAHRRFVLGDTSPEVLAAWLEVAVPLYTQTAPDPDAARRWKVHREATAWFNRPDGEGRHFDLRAGLGRIRCPTLVMGGLLDPMTPIGCQRDIAAAIDPRWVRYREFERCGHGVIPDRPVEGFETLRQFLSGLAAP
jgi:pimeloyl-ACP methyl ester carboxylesterase